MAKKKHKKLQVEVDGPELKGTFILAESKVLKFLKDLQKQKTDYKNKLIVNITTL